MGMRLRATTMCTELVHEPVHGVPQANEEAGVAVYVLSCTRHSILWQSTPIQSEAVP